MPPPRRVIEAIKLWSISIDKRHEDKPVVLQARQASDDRPVKLRITPIELRWLVEHAPKVLMEFDVCNRCSHYRSQHSGVQGELVRGVCSRCDRFCTKFAG